MPIIALIVYWLCGGLRDSLVGRLLAQRLVNLSILLRSNGHCPRFFLDVCRLAGVEDLEPALEAVYPYNNF